MVSQFMHSPRKEHFDVVYRILRYLKGTLGKGLLFENHGHLQVEAYTNVDWVGIKQIEDKILGIAPLLEVIWLLGRVRSRMQWLEVLQRQSLE